MGRYENTTRSKKVLSSIYHNRAGNVTKYNTTIYQENEKRNSDVFIITQHGDRLDNLAHQFYGDVTLWWYIAKANNLTFMALPTGTSLRIPATTQYAIGI